MTHQGVLLLLDAPLQSWGTQSRFSHRDTDFEPSKSGVIGLVGAALGMRRDEEELLEQLACLSMAVRVDREGRVLRDYHTVGGGTYRGEPHSVFGAKDTVVTNRFYLMDACFVVGLSGEDHSLIARIAHAVQNPVWPIFFGRRSCVPTRSVFLAGPLDGDASVLIRQVPYQPDHVSSDVADLRCILEDSEGKPRDDVPCSFRLYARQFSVRYVRDEWISLAVLPGGENASVEATAQ